MSNQAKIFVSYSRNDSEFVKRLVNDLGNSGVDVWFDQRDIRPGEEWDKRVEKALDASEIFLLVLSPKALKSQHVMNELHFAVSEGKRVVPILHRKCRLPLIIQRANYVDFTGPYDQALHVLVDALEGKIVGPRLEAKNRRLWKFNAAFLMLLAIAFFLRQDIARILGISESTILSISSMPVGAAVFVNGDSLGLTPVEVDASVSNPTKISIQKPEFFPRDTLLQAGGNADSIILKLKPLAQVSIRVEPSTANILLDGEEFSHRHLAGIALPAGEHEIELSAPGFVSKSERFVLRQGENPPLSYRLESEANSAPRFGRIQVISVPPGATTFIDSQVMGKTPYVHNSMLPGKHDVLIRLDGYEEYSTSIIIEAGKRQKVTTELVPLFGGIEITADPSGATVFLDGQEVGRAPYKSQAVSIGRREVILRLDGYAEVVKSVVVERDKTIAIHEEMERLKSQLIVLVEPYGSIFIDEKLRAKDIDRQYRTEIDPGEHKIRIQHPILGVWEKTVELKPDRPEEIHVDFNRYVRFVVTSVDETGKPMPAEIVVDGKATGEFTPKELSLRIGLHKVEVRLDGFESNEGAKELNLDENIREPLVFRLIGK